jgi:predicted nucleic acid-binding protein
MAPVTYLLDKSAWEQARYSSTAARLLARLIERRDLALCTTTALEMLYSARNTAEYNRDCERLGTFPCRDLSRPWSAVELQHALAQRGWHRTPLPDVMIAATAAEHELTVLHYDSDYERLADAAAIRHEWIIPRGTDHAGQ